MNENLPVHIETEREVGSITYANEVIAIIAGMAMNEVDGVASAASPGTFADLFGRAKPVTRGVKVEVGSQEASVDLVLTVEYGKPIQKVCVEVQESVRKAIETMTGLHVIKVDVHVLGVSFEKETQEMAKGYVAATQAGAIEPEAAPVAEPEADEIDDEIDTEIEDEPEADDVDATEEADEELGAEAEAEQEE